MTAVYAVSLLLGVGPTLAARSVRVPFRRRRAVASAARGQEHADWLGFNAPPPHRRRSPDVQHVTRAPRDATPHVIDAF